MFDFKPDHSTEQLPVPFFDDAIAAEGWEGHRTTKSLDQLQGEIAENLSLIGCLLSRVTPGTFGNRYGYQIHFVSKSADGAFVRHRLDIACLPLDPSRRLRNDYRSPRPRGVDWRVDATKKMGLFMVAKTIKGMWFLTVLAPAYVPFLSSLLLDNKTTMGEAWLQSGNLRALQPPKDAPFKENGDEEIIEGETHE